VAYREAPERSGTQEDGLGFGKGPFTVSLTSHPLVGCGVVSVGPVGRFWVATAILGVSNRDAGGNIVRIV
jgi:hypothetical protein